MTKHYNPTIIENANRILATKSGDYLSDEVENNIKMMMLLQSNERLLGGNNRATTGTSTAYTAPSDKDSYITALQISITADASSDSTQFLVNQTIAGTSSIIARYLKTTLTAYNHAALLTFPRAIKVERGTNITFTNAFTVGTANFSVIVLGYTEEVTR